MPREHVEVHLRYEGPDVEDGTMSLQDIVPVLQGFSGAYAELAKTDDPNSIHRVKITAVSPGSADIVLEVWRILGENAGQISVLGVLAPMVPPAFGLVQQLIQVIQVKRHVGNEPFEESISANNKFVIKNSKNVTIEVSQTVHDRFKSGVLDRGLEGITRPLDSDRIDTVELEAISDNGDRISERVFTEERPLFEIEELAVTFTRRTQLIVTFNSLTKSTNGGFLYFNGKRVSYRYKGDAPQRLYSIFGTQNDPVKVSCEAKMDENLEVLSLDIFEIEPLQPGLFDASAWDIKEDGDN